MPILPDMYPCKPDIFAATYAPISAPAPNVLDAMRFRALFGAAIAEDETFIDAFNSIFPDDDSEVTLDEIRTAIDASLAAQAKEMKPCSCGTLTRGCKSCTGRLRPVPLGETDDPRDRGKEKGEYGV